MPAIPRVKICGITNDEDAWAAIHCGADALGFLVGLFYRSEDELTPSDAAKLVSSLPPFVTSVLVTHQAESDKVQALCEAIRPHALQLHGPFPPEAIPEIRKVFPHLKILKAVHVQDEHSIELAREVAPYVDGIVLDTKTATRIEGTGIIHDWSVSRKIRAALPETAVILAGGLTPDNVERAITQVRPYAVDVNSGVSLSRGKSPSSAWRHSPAPQSAA